MNGLCCGGTETRANKTMDFSSYDRTPGFEQGLAARRRVLGEKYVGPSIARGVEDDFAHQIQQFVTEYC